MSFSQAPPHFVDSDGTTEGGFRLTDDPEVRVSTHEPHALCQVFGHQWHLFPYPLTMVFNPETGAHLLNTYRAICRRCPVTVLVEKQPGEAPCHTW
jgi:hypothetical protein